MKHDSRRRLFWPHLDRLDQRDVDGAAVTDPDRMQAAIAAIRATPVSDDANTMRLYLKRCEDEGRRPTVHGIGWNRERAELALVELKARGFIESPGAA